MASINHNSFFLKEFNKNHQISVLRNAVLSAQNTDYMSFMNYVNNINDFCNEYLVDNKNKNLEDLIIYNYWLYLLIYIKNKKQEVSLVEDTLWRFMISAVRIIEFAIIIYSENDKELENTYFNVKKFDASLFEHFHDIQNNKNVDISIDFLCDEKSRAELIHIILNAKYTYISQIQTSSNLDSDSFNLYFKLSNEKVLSVYCVHKPLKTGTNAKRDGSSNTYDESIKSNAIDSKRFSYAKNEIGVENQNEQNSRANKIQSPLLDREIANEVFEDKDRKNKNSIVLDSKFKQHQINRAISNNICKHNMNLSSFYAYPKLDNLINFIAHLKDENEINNPYLQVILISIILGISVEKLLYMIYSKDRSSSFYSKFTKVTFRLDDGIFAEAKELDGIDSENIKKKEVKLELSPLLVSYLNDLFKSLQEFIKSKTFKDDVENFANSINDFLSKNIKSFDKTIVLSQKSLSQLSLYYYRLQNNISDISLLFSINLSKSDSARVCYVSHRYELYELKHWIDEFISILNLDQPSIFIHKQAKDYAGSPYFIKPGKLKTFFKNLEYLQVEDDELLNDNITMIFLRYALSLLLATRKGANSCDLSNYLRRENLLLIQEKAKDLISSKRIVPLTKRATEYLELFNTLKKKYNLSSSSPVLLLRNNANEIKEIVINKRNLLDFLDKLEHPSSCLVDEVMKFIRYSQLNFGRHVFSTQAIKCDYLDNYEIDFFLNHFKFGVVDQGTYSNFDNQKYFTNIREFINELSNRYFPKFINI